MKKLFFAVMLFHLITAPMFAHHNGIHHHHSELGMSHCMIQSHHHEHQNNLNTLKHKHTHASIVDFFLTHNPKVLFILKKSQAYFSTNFWLPHPLLKDFFRPPRI